MKRSLLIAGLVLMIVQGYAQTIRWAKGEDLNFLDGEKTLKILICYDSMTFDNGKSEMAYQEEVAKAYDAEVPGKGQKYLERWKLSKEKVFTDYFMKDFPKAMGKFKMKAGPDVKGNRYLMKIYPLTVTTGAATMPFQRGAPAYTDFRISFVEEADPKNEVGSVFIYQVMGTPVGYDMDQSFIGRFKNCFWFGGMALGRDMVRIKKAKK